MKFLGVVILYQLNVMNALKILPRMQYKITFISNQQMYSELLNRNIFSDV